MFIKLIEAALAALILILTFILNNDWLDQFQGVLAALLMIAAGIVFVLALWGDRLSGPKAS